MHMVHLFMLVVWCCISHASVCVLCVIVCVLPRMYVIACLSFFSGHRFSYGVASSYVSAYCGFGRARSSSVL